MPTGTTDLIEEFQRRWEGTPRLYRAPGRVNLIGEHTDYNDGFVMPAALEFATTTAILPRDDRKVRVHSLALSETAEFDLDQADPKPRRDWTDYVRGVALMLERAGHRLRGADLMLHSSVPLGAGMSSSAALEVSVGYALLAESGLPIDLIDLARRCQEAENGFVGMRCGVMDQFISCHGVAGHAVLLDCRSLDFRPVPVDPRARLVICNTMVHHQLAGSEYNLRRQDCERGVELLSPALGPIRALRDVSLAQLERHADRLPEVTYRRCRHIVTENARVLEAATALENGDLHRFGRLMIESHESMRDDYQISCRELDVMVALSLPLPGVYGARMTGGGFGGCSVSLVDADAVGHFMKSIAEAYREATGIVPAIFTCVPGSHVDAVKP
ncbi:galactokinase [Telmatospirillum siberiense]|uniref:Galactokinase n=1 Tax=Telmatospirillum siberiense TaxID=382514 RepID=A0A2N3PZA4_9PROT|nr:galactokinase [Telmatospirillum siberiense]PKU25715.1 galactokinase [Telmatospirillum siberiense]